MPKTATPRKPETVSRKLAETRNTSKSRSLSSLLGIGDNEKRLATDLGSGLNDVIGRGTIAGLLGLPGDLGGAAENGLRSLLGLPQVVPYGGSEHIGQKMEQAGLVSDVRRPKTELLASLISPAQAATAGYKAPQMARAGVKALDNLSAPRTMGRQQGAIENLWHGSPHTFDRFDLSKIGTGEGAQAFGHGAYLAESADTARTYSADRAYVGKVMAGLPPDTNFNDPNWLAQKVVDETGDLGKAKAHLRMIQRTAGKYQSDETKAITQASIDLIESGNVAPKGNLYQTRLAWPDAREATDPLSPDHFLHWDKPLSEQSPYVRELLKKRVVDAQPADGFDMGGGSLLRDNRNGQVDPDSMSPWFLESSHGGETSRYKMTDSDIERMFGQAGASNLTGEQVLSRFAQDMGGQSDASTHLRDLGIPGIRYLDGGSRGAGAGSHNYVVFDDKLIDIVSRNGQPVGNLGKMVAPQDEALRVAQGGESATLSGMGSTPKPTRSEILARAKAIGISPVGKNDEILSKLSILERDPSTWSVDDFSKVADELDIHQDFRGASQDPEALNSILSEGLRSGMSDNLGHMYSKKFYTYGKGLSGGRSFIFPSRSIKYVSDSNPRFAPGNKPLFYMDATEGQDIYEAFKTAKRNPNYKP